jgi:hypothetical protein
VSASSSAIRAGAPRRPPRANHPRRARAQAPPLRRPGVNSPSGPRRQSCRRNGPPWLFGPASFGSKIQSSSLPLARSDRARSRSLSAGCARSPPRRRAGRAVTLFPETEARQSSPSGVSAR